MRIKSRQTPVAYSPSPPLGLSRRAVQGGHPGISQGPEHPEDSELEQIGTMRYDKDDWLWAYPDPTRPRDEDLLSVEELLERRA